jgi:hypothetical protein
MQGTLGKAACSAALAGLRPSVAHAFWLAITISCTMGSAPWAGYSGALNIGRPLPNVRLQREARKVIETHLWPFSMVPGTDMDVIMAVEYAAARHEVSGGGQA